MFFFVVVFVVVVVVVLSTQCVSVMVEFSSLARVRGKCSTTRSPPVPFFFSFFF